MQRFNIKSFFGFGSSPRLACQPGLFALCVSFALNGANAAEHRSSFPSLPFFFLKFETRFTASSNFFCGCFGFTGMSGDTSVAFFSREWRICRVFFTIAQIYMGLRWRLLLIGLDEQRNICRVLFSKQTYCWFAWMSDTSVASLSRSNKLHNYARAWDGGCCWLAWMSNRICRVLFSKQISAASFSGSNNYAWDGGCCWFAWISDASGLLTFFCLISWTLFSFFFALGFESDRLDVWLCKRGENKRFLEELIFEWWFCLFLEQVGVSIRHTDGRSQATKRRKRRK